MRKLIVSVVLVCLLFEGVASQTAPKYIEHWNKLATTYYEEDGLFERLKQVNESYERDPPTFVRSQDRLNTLKEFAELTERRLKALRALIKIEEGK
jgi:hypothetical protein